MGIGRILWLIILVTYVQDQHVVILKKKDQHVVQVVACTVHGMHYNALTRAYV